MNVFPTFRRGKKLAVGRGRSGGGVPYHGTTGTMVNQALTATIVATVANTNAAPKSSERSSILSDVANRLAGLAVAAWSSGVMT